MLVDSKTFCKTPWITFQVFEVLFKQNQESCLVFVQHPDGNWYISIWAFGAIPTHLHFSTPTHPLAETASHLPQCSQSIQTFPCVS